MGNTWKRGAELKLKNPFKPTILTFATTNFNLKKNFNLIKKTQSLQRKRQAIHVKCRKQFSMEMTITTRN